MNRAAWTVTLAATALMALVGGGRSAFGLFVGPLNQASGIGLAAFSLALALGQLAIGFAQPLVGALADRFGAARLVVPAAAALALLTALPALWPLPTVLVPALIAGAVAGCAVGSNGLLIGELARAVPPARAAFAVAVAGSGLSVGLMLLGPLTQWAIDGWGWRAALLATAAASLLAWPLAWLLRRPAAAAPAPRTHAPSAVLREWRFWRIALSFGACGFHVAFLAAHMPGVIERCGLPAGLAGPWIALSGLGNVAGGLAVGLLLQRQDPGRVLAAVYALRVLAIAALLALPVSPAVMLGFALAMGATHMATLPPTSALVARAYGVQNLGTLFGVVMLVHQAGSFAGIWFGGWAAEATGGDTLVWAVDIALASGAALLAWPGRFGAYSARHPVVAPCGRSPDTHGKCLPLLHLPAPSGPRGQP